MNVYRPAHAELSADNNASVEATLNELHAEAAQTTQRSAAQCSGLWRRQDSKTTTAKYSCQASSGGKTSENEATTFSFSKCSVYTCEDFFGPPGSRPCTMPRACSHKLVEAVDNSLSSACRTAAAAGGLQIRHIPGPVGAPRLQVPSRRKQRLVLRMRTQVDNRIDCRDRSATGVLESILLGSVRSRVV